MKFLRGLFANPERPITSSGLATEILDNYAKGQTVFNGRDLAGIKLPGAKLQKAQFKEANLKGADLRGADLSYCDLRLTDLQDANLQGADLTGALMLRTDLYGANLSETTFMPRFLDQSFALRADFSGAVMKADFDEVHLGLGTKFHMTNLAFCDLSKVIYASQMESVIEEARKHNQDAAIFDRCDVDLATLGMTAKALRYEANRLKSAPESLIKFFRDCGMDEDLLTSCFSSEFSPQCHSEERKHDVFISFKDDGCLTRDATMAQELHEFLTKKGLRVFMSNISLEELGTAKFKETIDEALNGAHVLVVVANSLENIKSPWVSYEWNSFSQDILSNVRPNGQIFTYLNGVPLNDLPRSLRQVQSFEEGADGLERLYRQLAIERSQKKKKALVGLTAFCALVLLLMVILWRFWPVAFDYIVGALIFFGTAVLLDSIRKPRGAS